MLGVLAGCSSDSKTTTSASGATTSASSSGGGSATGIAAGDHLVVPAPSEQEGFARLVAVTLDDSGTPLVAYVSSPPDDSAEPDVRAVTYDEAADRWRDPVLVGQLTGIRGALRATSGAADAVTITFEADAGSATFTSSDGGTTWAATQPLPAGTGDPATATAPDGRTFTVHVVRTGSAPGIYVAVS